MKTTAHNCISLSLFRSVGYQVIVLQLYAGAREVGVFKGLEPPLERIQPPSLKLFISF